MQEHSDTNTRKASINLYQKMFSNPHDLNPDDPSEFSLEVERTGDSSASIRVRLSGGGLGTKSGGIRVSGKVAEAIVGDGVWRLLGEGLESA